MRRAALACDGCGFRLAWRRPNGKERIEPDVVVVRFADGATALTCPACGEVRWRGAAVVWLVPPKAGTGLVHSPERKT